MSDAEMGRSTPTTYESHVLHVSGAITIPNGGREQPLLTALSGLIAVSAGLDAAGAPAHEHPYVVIVNTGEDPLSYARAGDRALTYGSLATGRTAFPLARAAAAHGGEMRTLQLQIGPVPAAAAQAQGGGGGDVLTLVLSAEEATSGAVTFVGQGIGGRAG